MPENQRNCLEKLTIDQDNTYLDEIRGTHRTSLYDWQKEITTEGELALLGG